MNRFPASFVDVPNDTDPPVRDIFRVHTLHFILFVIYEELSWPNTVTRIKGKACDTSEQRSHIQLSCEFTSWILMRNSYSDSFLPSLTSSFPAGPIETPLIPWKCIQLFVWGYLLKACIKYEIKNIYSVMQGLPPNCNIGISISIFKIPNTICEKMQMLYYYSTWKRSISHGLYNSNENVLY